MSSGSGLSFKSHWNQLINGMLTEPPVLKHLLRHYFCINHRPDQFRLSQVSLVGVITRGILSTLKDDLEGRYRCIKMTKPLYAMRTNSPRDHATFWYVMAYDTRC